MDASQVALPILGIVAAAAVTFYAVSFAEMREVISSRSCFSSFSTNIHSPVYVLLVFALQKSFRELDESETETGGGFQSSASSRQRRARRKAEKEARK